MRNTNPFTIKRDLEIALESLQAIEQLNSAQREETPAQNLSKAMVPSLFMLQEAISALDAFNQVNTLYIKTIIKQDLINYIDKTENELED